MGGRAEDPPANKISYLLLSNYLFVAFLYFVCSMAWCDLLSFVRYFRNLFFFVLIRFFYVMFCLVI